MSYNNVYRTMHTKFIAFFPGNIINLWIIKGILKSKCDNYFYNESENERYSVKLFLKSYMWIKSILEVSSEKYSVWK